MPTFTTPKKLQQHLIHHVLSPPESLGWGLVWRSRFPCLADDPTMIDQCFRLRKLGRESPERPATPEDGDTKTKPNPDAELFWDLSDAYEAEIRYSHQRSQRLGWTTQHEENSVHFDPYGIALVLRWKDGQARVRTAYLPGFGAREQVIRSQLDPDNVHVRARSAMRARGASPNGSKANAKRSGGQEFGQPRKNQASENQNIWQRLDHRRASHWDDDQKLYHLVFRPAVQMIRSLQPMDSATVRKLATKESSNADDGTKQRQRRFLHKLTVGAVKTLLPKQSELKFDSWKKLMATSEGGVSSSDRQECREEKTE